MEIEQAAQTPDSAAKDSLQPMTKPKSIGGWLLLFCFGTIIGTPVRLLAEITGSKLVQVYVVDSVLICASLTAGICGGHRQQQGQIIRSNLLSFIGDNGRPDISGGFEYGRAGQYAHRGCSRKHFIRICVVTLFQKLEQSPRDLQGKLVTAFPSSGSGLFS